MQRTKKLKLIITFPTTTAAMAAEYICPAGYGRLIPIPSEISGGCGLAWCAEPAQEITLLKLLQENNIPYQEKRLLSLY